jgi:hypothetical protein
VAASAAVMVKRLSPRLAFWSKTSAAPRPRRRSIIPGLPKSVVTTPSRLILRIASLS